MTAVLFLVFVAAMTLAGVGIGARQAFYAQILTARTGVVERDTFVDGAADDALDDEPLEVSL